MRVNFFVFCGESKSWSFALKRKHPQNSTTSESGALQGWMGGGGGVTITPFFEETLEDPTHLISSESAAATPTGLQQNASATSPFTRTRARRRRHSWFAEKRPSTQVVPAVHVVWLKSRSSNTARDSRRLGPKTMDFEGGACYLLMLHQIKQCKVGPNPKPVMNLSAGVSYNFILELNKSQLSIYFGRFDTVVRSEQAKK